MPTVSVVIPSYCHAPFLARAIESVLEQTRPPDEVIVVDDGSTDGSPEEIRRFGSRIRAVFQENRGTCAALNRGMAMAKGEWIAIQNSDDAWEPQKLERQLAVCDRIPGCGAVHTGVRYMDEEGHLLEQPPGADLSRYEGRARGDLLPVLLHCMPIAVSSAMISRGALQLTGGFDPLLLGMGDWDFFLRLSLHAAFEHVPEPLTWVRKHRGSAGMDPSRLPSDWQDRDWRILAGSTMPAAARALFQRAREGRTDRREAARSLAALGFLYTLGGDRRRARAALVLSARLDPLRWQTHARLALALLPARRRRDA